MVISKSLRKDQRPQPPKVAVKREVKEKDITPNYWEQMTEEDIKVVEFVEEEKESIYDAAIYSIINTYQRCQKFNALPISGGLDDQVPFMLDCFDIITDEISKYESSLYQR